MRKNIVTEQLLQEALNQVSSADQIHAAEQKAKNKARDWFTIAPKDRPQPPAINFIFFGGGSGNVYGVSSATDFEQAFKDVTKELHLAYAASDTREAPECDPFEAMQRKGEVKINKHNGYWIVVVKQSDEGQFGLLDVHSTNPDVQAEIKNAGLMKYAQEFLATKDESITEDEEVEDPRDTTGDLGVNVNKCPICTMPDGSGNLVFIDAVCRGGFTEYYWDPKTNGLYYWGENPENPSDGMVIKGLWLNADELETRPTLTSEIYTGKIPRSLKTGIKWVG